DHDLGRHGGGTLLWRADRGTAVAHARRAHPGADDPRSTGPRPTRADARRLARQSPDVSDTVRFDRYPGDLQIQPPAALRRAHVPLSEPSGDRRGRRSAHGGRHAGPRRILPRTTHRICTEPAVLWPPAAAIVVASVQPPG